MNKVKHKTKKRSIIFEGCSSVGGFTEIDAVYDVKGKALIMIGINQKGKTISTGQKILFDRMVMWCQKPVYAITAWSNQKDNIVLKDCVVKEVRIKSSETGKPITKTVINKITVRKMVEEIEKRYGVSKNG